MIRFLLPLLAAITLIPAVVTAAETAPATAVPTEELAPKRLVPWTELTDAQREQTVQAWEKLDETTRPPFPIFRQQLEESDATTDKTADPHSAVETPIKNP